MNKSLKDGRERGGCSYISIVTMRRHAKSKTFWDFPCCFRAHIHGIVKKLKTETACFGSPTARKASHFTIWLGCSPAPVQTSRSGGLGGTPSRDPWRSSRCSDPTSEHVCSCCTWTPGSCGQDVHRKQKIKEKEDLISTLVFFLTHNSIFFSLDSLSHETFH